MASMLSTHNENHRCFANMTSHYGLLFSRGRPHHMNYYDNKTTLSLTRQQQQHQQSKLYIYVGSSSSTSSTSAASRLRPQLCERQPQLNIRAAVRTNVALCDCCGSNTSLLIEETTQCCTDDDDDDRFPSRSVCARIYRKFPRLRLLLLSDEQASKSVRSM